MKVYQLRLIEFGECLEPVFKTEESARIYMEKYKTRNIVLKTHYLENIENERIYRIRTEESAGYYLEDDVYASYNEAVSYIKASNQKVVESCLY